MGEGVVVKGPPVLTGESRDKKQQGGFGLMEVCDDSFDEPVFIAGGNDDTGGGDQCSLPYRLQMGYDGVEGFRGKIGRASCRERV